MLRQNGEAVPPSKMAVACGLPADSPELTEAVARWKETDAALTS
jgi:hypothetical protein